MLKKFPHTYVIVFSIIIVSALLTWVIPGGEFNRQTIDVNGTERQVIEPGSFHITESNPQSWQIFTAMFKGFEKQSGIIAFILILGGAFWILNQTRSIDRGIHSFVKYSSRLEKFSFFRKVGLHNVIFTIIILMFSLFGAIFGMSEETIAFVIIFVPFAISLGYDSITGVALCYLAAHVGFAGAMLNPFTIGIAQGISQVPPFSGLEYRFFCWIIITLSGIVFILWYANKVKRNPKKSPVYKEDEHWRTAAISKDGDEIQKIRNKRMWMVFGIVSAILIYWAIRLPLSEITAGDKSAIFPVLPVITGIFIVFAFISLFRSVHYFILSLLMLTIFMLVAGVMAFQWYIMEIAGLFLAMGVFSGWAYGYGPNQIVKHFLEGSKDILSAALIVGLAGGIIVVLQEGKVIDSILNSVSHSMRDMGNVASVGIMYTIQTFINVIIPSGSAKAALTMPIMSQFSDLIGISRQATVMAFQFGDGFTNMITPTSGVLLGVLSMAKIPYQKWLKFIWPFMLFLIILGFLLLIPTVTMKLNGF
ncbi:MAG: short-chain fatty acid transporter [Bacteroidetes bacterium HGW-Bacteroidetes-21]|jgi:uncharacterized ion transporter superfamily protein YfcC|nr:MAG: short-chain fatty acid transporter [Bacteroidetes bacterium HGW-Bacteroidetes-21]